MPVFERPTLLAHRQVMEVLRPGDLAIDATAGNGHDTVFLARAVGETGRVLAFDIQAVAIAAARARVEAAGLTGRTGFVHGSHAAMLDHVAPGSAGAVMFNLGYFPGGDHRVITRTPETLLGLDAALKALKSPGILTVVCYPGHPGGDEESAAVTAWCESLAGSGFSSAVMRPAGVPPGSPFLARVIIRGSANR